MGRGKSSKKNTKANKDDKVLTMGGIILVIIILVFGYTFVKGLGVVKENPQLAASLLAI